MYHLYNVYIYIYIYIYRYIYIYIGYVSPCGRFFYGAHAYDGKHTHTHTSTNQLHERVRKRVYFRTPINDTAAHGWQRGWSFLRTRMQTTILTYLTWWMEKRNDSHYLLVYACSPWLTVTCPIVPVGVLYTTPFRPQNAPVLLRGVVFFSADGSLALGHRILL